MAIGQKKMQGINMAHSFLWDHEKDHFVEYTYDMPAFFVQAVVYGIYFDWNYLTFTLYKLKKKISTYYVHVLKQSTQLRR